MFELGGTENKSIASTKDNLFVIVNNQCFLPFWSPLPPVTFDCLCPPCFHHLRVLCFSVMLQPTPTTFGPKLFYTCVDTRTSIYFDYF